MRPYHPPSENMPRSSKTLLENFLPPSGDFPFCCASPGTGVEKFKHHMTILFDHIIYCLSRDFLTRLFVGFDKVWRWGGDRASKATGGMRSRNMRGGEGETSPNRRKRAHSANTGRRRAPVSGEGRTGELRREWAPALARGRRGSDVRKGCILARTGRAHLSTAPSARAKSGALRGGMVGS